MDWWNFTVHDEGVLLIAAFGIDSDLYFYDIFQC